MSEKVYSWDNCPNIRLSDKRVVWWNEQEIAIKKAGRRKEMKKEAGHFVYFRNRYGEKVKLWVRNSKSKNSGGRGKMSERSLGKCYCQQQQSKFQASEKE